MEEKERQDFSYDDHNKEPEEKELTGYDPEATKGEGADFEAESFRSYEEPHQRPAPRYEELFDAARPKSKGWSVASMVIGIISVICCCLGWSGIVLGALAIAFAIISRVSLKYFDGMAIAGLVLGIFGLMFGIMMIWALYGPAAQAFEDAMKDFNWDSLPEDGSIPSDF